MLGISGATESMVAELQIAGPLAQNAVLSICIVANIETVSHAFPIEAM